MMTRRATGALIGVALLLAACGSSSDSGDPAAAPGVDAGAETTPPAAEPVAEPAAEPAPEAATEPTAVPAALQFSAPLVGGGEIDAATLAGKPTVFWFWAPT